MNYAHRVMQAAIAARIKRALKFKALYDSGKTLQWIGNKHGGISRERVRQLIASLK